MSNIKLTYFDFHGGRGEPIRMALSLGGIEFDDERISFPQFGEMRKNFPLRAVPIMQLDGVMYTQTNAMLRYAGALSGLYPSDPREAFLCDEILDIGEDMFHAIGKTFGLEGEDFIAARAKMAEGPFTDALKLFDARLDAAGGEYFAGNRLTIADFKVFVAVRTIMSGMLDHMPTDLVNKVAPNLIAHMERVASESRVASYLAALK